MSDPRPRWKLESIPDLLGTVPYLLGFHPSDSGVIVGKVKGKPAKRGPVKSRTASAFKSLRGELAIQDTSREAMR